MAGQAGNPLNWRRGIEEIEQGSRQTSQALQSRAAMTDAVGQRYSDSINKVAGNIAKGIDGIADTIQKTEELRIKRDNERRQRELQDAQEKRANELHPLAVQGAQQNIQMGEQNLKASKYKLEKTEEEDKTKEAGVRAANQAIVDGYKGKKPANYNDMTLNEKASFINSVVSVEKSDLDIKGKRVAIAATNQTIAKGEVDAVKAVDELTKNVAPAALQGYKSNPDSVATIGMTKEQLKEVGERFDGYEKKSNAYAKSQSTRKNLFKIMGVKVADPNGIPTDDEMMKVVEESGGIAGIVNKYKNDPRSSQIKGAMVAMISAQAEAGNFKIQSDNDVKMASEGMGGGLGVTDTFNDGNFLDRLEKIQRANGNGVGLFRTMLSREAELKTELQKDIVGNDGFKGSALTRRSTTLYNQLPYTMKDPDSSQYISQQEFMARPVQEQYNATYGFDSKTQQPNVAAPTHWQQDHQFVSDLNDPVKYSSMQQKAAAQTKEFSFDSPINQRAMEKVKEFRSNAAVNFSSPGAGAGISKPAGPVPAAHATDEQVDVAKGNSNTPVVFSSDPDMPPRFMTVSQPNGKAAAGATPRGKQAGNYSSDVKKKFGLGGVDVKSLFKATGE